PFEQPRPYAPGQQHEGIGIIPAKEQRVIFPEPFFEGDESGAILPAFHFGNGRRLLRSEQVQVDVMAAAAKPTCAGKRIAFGADPECVVAIDYLNLDAVALPAMAGAAHGRPPADLRASSVWTRLFQAFAVFLAAATTSSSTSPE